MIAHGGVTRRFKMHYWPVGVAILHRPIATSGLIFKIRFFSPGQEEAAEKTEQRNQKCYPENNRYAGSDGLLKHRFCRGRQQ